MQLFDFHELTKDYIFEVLDNEFTKVNGGIFQLYDVFSINGKELSLDMN